MCLKQQGLSEFNENKSDVNLRSNLFRVILRKKYGMQLGSNIFTI